MSRRTIGVLVLLGLALLLGVLSGQFFFDLWERTVPQGMRTSFHTASAHAVFLWRGLVLGLAFFGWGLLSPLVMRAFRPRQDAVKP